MTVDADETATGRLETALGRIRERNGELNLVTALDEAGAREAAAASDARRAAGTCLGALDGVLVGVKDNIPVRGLPHTAGLGAWRDRIADRDAPVVSRLRAAGAIPFAALIMEEGALGAVTNNPHYGRASNPLDPDRTPGGSSGGSGGAVAAGFVDAALGTDTMGSVRVPAAYCGVAGLKPTRGLIPRTGMTFLSPTLDSIGPIARDAALIAEMMSVMAGAEPGDPHAVSPPADWRPEAAPPLWEGLSIGIPRQIADVTCEGPVIAGLAAARAAFEDLGARIVDVDMRGWEPGRSRRGGLLLVEAEGAVELAPFLAGEDETAMSAHLRDLLIYGRDLSSGRLVEALARIEAAAAAARRAFGECDVLLLPTAPQRAFRHDAPIPDNQADFTALANFHGGPALALPIHLQGLPASVQLFGPAFSEGLLLAMGRALLARLA